MKLLAYVLTGLLALWVPGGWDSSRVMSVVPAALPEAPYRFPEANPQDLSVFEQKLQVASAEQTLAAQNLAVALSFLGTPYVHGTLEQGPQEQLVVNLHELDCWTFIENSLAIALTAKKTAPTFDSLQEAVQQLRYWGGKVNGYASRIHYFTGWLLQAEKSGYLTDITRELGAEPYRKKISYMSSRPAKYPPLKDGDTWKKLKAVEDHLNSHTWFYIPQNRVARMEHLLKEGDIVALTSWKRDLDIAHQGIAVRKNGRMHLLHASSLHKRVILSAQPISQYLLSQKGQTGIIVARLSTH